MSLVCPNSPVATIAVLALKQELWGNFQDIAEMQVEWAIAPSVSLYSTAYLRRNSAYLSRRFSGSDRVGGGMAIAKSGRKSSLPDSIDW